ncbi:AAA family ATPase [Tardiphaga sp.]|uniref:AAA family ATPase n=1 Tax=Tardiphaga sp. TaxID=1926292 RepID=UPI00260AD0D1|nr:AAA family ATPase [Tardiphaga sp.]MDB5616227.1 hypothetical protein [Tardiphaga sp.]
MNAPFARSPSRFDEFFAMGFARLVPVIPHDAPISVKSSLFSRVGTSQDGRGKTPGVRGNDGLWYSFDWTKHEADARDLTRWQAMSAGVGVKMGAGLYFIDADTMDKLLAANIHMTVVKHFGVLCCRVGNFPKAGYLIRLSAPLNYMRIDFGPANAAGTFERVEILGEGKQAVFAGTHPKTKLPYTWVTPLVPFDQVPVFSPAQVIAFLDELRTILPAATKVITEGGGADVPQASLKGDLDTVRKAVKATPNTSKTFGTREAYRDFGYAIKAALPEQEPEAFELFQEWCDRWQDGTNDPAIVAADWRRMRGPYRRGASWLFELAEQENPEAFKNVDRFFDVIPDEAEPLFDTAPATPEAKTDTYPILRIGDIVNRPPPIYLIKRHFPEISVGFLYAAPGAGKTFLALDAALHIAYALPAWHGDAIKAEAGTAVVYIAAEGSFGFRNRILAWLQKRNQTVHSDRFVMIERTIDFMEAGDIDRLLRTVSSVIGARPVLIVVDTVSQAIPGADENLQKEMTLFVKACNRVKETFRCAVLGIHHAGKNGDMRGSTVLRGAGDFVFRLDRKEGASVGRLWCEKQKDGPDGWSEPYRFDHVSLDAGESSWVPERCEQSIGPDKALTPVLAIEVLGAMASAWSAGEPWGRTYRSRELMASRRMVEDFDFSMEKAEQMIGFWIASGDIVEATHSAKTKRKGFQVVRRLDVAPVEAGTSLFD